MYWYVTVLTIFPFLDGIGILTFTSVLMKVEVNLIE